jgi:hypothetical protein
MSVKAAVALALALAAAPARADEAPAPAPPPPPPPGTSPFGGQVAAAAPARLPVWAASVGFGKLGTDTASGRTDATTLSLTGDWRPLRDPLWGLRARYGYGSIEDGTSLVYSTRRSHMLATHATRHWRATGDLYLFGGLGLGMAVIHTRHQVGGDASVGYAFEPAWTWTAGADLVFYKFWLRFDVAGLWHQVSHDISYGGHVGMSF